MTAPAQPPPPAEALLIRLAREAAGLSPETASATVDAVRIGGSRWRQIEAGYRNDTGRSVKAKPATLAHMALAVGVTSERLAETGRDDAAAVLRELEIQHGIRNPGVEADEESTPRVDDRWRMIKAMLDQAYEGLTPGEYRALVRRISGQMERNPEWRPGGDISSEPRRRAAGDG